MPKEKKNTTLVSSFKKGSLLAVIATALLITVVVSYIEFHTFSNEAKELESEYIASKKALIKQEVLRVTKYISRVRAQTQQKIKARIKSRVYEAHSIATNIYNKFNGVLTEQKIKKLIVEALRPLRFFNADGYYYIHSLNGISQLQPLTPHVEGTNRLNLKSSNNQYIVKDLLSIIKKSEEGFLSYSFHSFKHKNREREKIAFVKLFKPYNWSIGTGDYLENIEHDIKKEILEHIGHIKFSENSYIFVVDFNGNILMNASQKNLIGTNMSKLTDPNGVNVFLEERKAVEKPEGDFIYYVWNKPSSSNPSPKMSFMKAVQDWKWMIGTGLYIDDIQEIIQQQDEKLKNELINQYFYIFLIVILSSLFILIISNKFSKRFTAETGLFLSFFTKVSEQAEKIDIDRLKFIEFKELAVSANHMLDKKIAAEKSLNESEASLKEAQRITHFGSWELDIKNNKLHWSDEVYRIFELSPEETKPTYEKFLSYIHPKDRHAVDEGYHQSIKNKTPYDIEHRILLANGKIKYVREHAETYYDKDGNAESSSGTIQNITEVKEKEEQLKRTQKMDALGKLIGGIAHDYNNMMGIVLGYSELLLSQVAGKEKAIEYVVQIRTAGERARELTERLMTFSRFKPSETKIININEQIQQQQHLLEKILTSRIKLIMDLEDSLWLTNIDPGDLNDAIINITINASHAIVNNGKVKITTCNSHINDHEAETLDLVSGDYISISISDSGSGIDPQVMPTIFDPFFSTKGDLGTGLGLSQVYGFTKRSGGAIKVLSDLGLGTEFTLYFPRFNEKKENNVEKINEVKDVSLEQRHETILVVDDEEALCDIACALLREKGYQALKALDAKQALDILKAETVDLVFSDIVMPQMTGYELATKISTKYPNIIIQLTSGFNDTRSLNIDTSDMNILTKPYSKSDLLKRIQEALAN